jgi:mRNA-degrading endonuclease RelE of RelBE toxin-antitoxin system
VARRIDWTIRAEKDLRPLDRPLKVRIIEGLERYAETEHGDIRRLQGVDPPEFAIRIGEWRVGVYLTAEVMTVLWVRPRQSAYRDK